MRVAGREYRDGVRNLEVMLESLSGGRRREIQEDGIVMEVKFFYLSVWDKCIWSADNVYLAQVKLILS